MAHITIDFSVRWLWYMKFNLLFYVLLYVMRVETLIHSFRHLIIYFSLSKLVIFKSTIIYTYKYIHKYTHIVFWTWGFISRSHVVTIWSPICWTRLTRGYADLLSPTWIVLWSWYSVSWSKVTRPSISSQIYWSCHWQMTTMKTTSQW